MGIVISSILLLAVILSGVLIVTGAMMNSVDSAVAAGKETGKIITERALTSIDITAAGYVSGAAWSEAKLLNNGHSNIGDFNEWDVFIQYRDTNPNNYMHYEWIAYSPTYPPSAGQWAKNGIYLDSNATVPEVYEPGIFNPGEYLKLTVKVSNPIKNNTWVYIKASTGNGADDDISYLK